MYSQDHNGPRFIWTVGFLALGTLSAIGAAALFPWYLAIAIAVLVVGLASACAYQFRATNNPLYLVAMCLMTALASFLDGVSVWELLNETQNSGLHAASANEGAIGTQLKSTQEQAESIRAQIAAVVQEYTNMDNDGNGANDGLIPGKIALAESLKADLANVQARVDDLQAKTIAAASTTAVTDAERHILLQMADEHPHPAQWLIMWASVVFLIPEFTLALLAWSMHGHGRNGGQRLDASSPAYASLEQMQASQLSPQVLHYLLQQQLHTVQALAPVQPMMAQAPMAPVAAVPPVSIPAQPMTLPAQAGSLAPVAVAGRSTTTTTTRQEAVEFASQPSPGPAAPGVGPVETGPVPALPVGSAESAVPSVAPSLASGEEPFTESHSHPEGVDLSREGWVHAPSSSERPGWPVARPGHISPVREAKKRGAFGGSPTRMHKEKSRTARDLTRFMRDPSSETTARV